jgi:hypothetical protein
MLEEGLHNDRWVRDIKGALTIPVLMQFLSIRQWLQEFHLDPSTPDRLEWKWTSSGEFSASSAYKALFLGQQSVEGSKELWKMSAEQM